MPLRTMQLDVHSAPLQLLAPFSTTESERRESSQCGLTDCSRLQPMHARLKKLHSALPIPFTLLPSSSRLSTPESGGLPLAPSAENPDLSPSVPNASALNPQIKLPAVSLTEDRRPLRCRLLLRDPIGPDIRGGETQGGPSPFM
jgi:hypothetical protein